MPIQLSGSGSITGVSTLTSLASLDVTGSVSVGGTLIYDDVTNIDSIGIVTARSDVHVGAGLSVTGISTFNAYLDINGDINIDGSQITYTSSSNQLKFADDAQLRFGAGNDLRIYHDGDNSYISDAGTGGLNIQGSTVTIEHTGGNHAIVADGNGATNIYYQGSKKFQTTNTGAVVTGTLTATSFSGSGASLDDVLTSTSLQHSIEYPTIRPTLDLNFAATKTLDRRITFTRDSLGTYIDENGLVKYASNNVPRFDHDPTTGESLGLLIEEARTNQILYSLLTTDNWTANGSTLSNNTTETTAPDGTNTAGKWVPNNGNIGWCSIYNKSTISVTSGTAYTFSVWAKATHSDYTVFKITGDVRDGGGTNFNVLFTLSGDGSVDIDGHAEDGNADSASIEKYPNGWYRCIVTQTADATTTEEPGFGANVNGDGTKGFYTWGYQVEAGAFPTSYIPTSGSTVTRADDFATIKGTNFTDFYNQTEGTLFGEFTIKDTYYSSAAIVNINQEPGSSYAHSIMFVEIGTANGYFGRTYKNSSGVNISNSSSVLNSLHPSTTPQKVSFGYTTVSGGELRAYWNGNSVDSRSDLSKVPTTLTNMRIGRGWTGSDVINAHIKKLSYYNKRLPNAQLQGLTQQ